MSNKTSPLILGRIKGTYGVKGWVKLTSFTRPKDNIQKYHSLLINRSGDWQQADIENQERRGTQFLIKFAGIGSPEEAQALVGADIAIDHKTLPDLPDGQYYWHQLIGLSVIDQHEQRLGSVKEIVETGANDVLVIIPDMNNHPKVLIPLIIGMYVMSIDLEKDLIYVDWQQAD